MATYEHPHLLGILLPLPVVHGFFLYTYTRQVTTTRSGSESRYVAADFGFKAGLVSTHVPVSPEISSFSKNISLHDLFLLRFLFG